MAAIRWIENLFDKTLVGPMLYKGKVQAGTTGASLIDDGVLLERTADTNTRWIAADSDHDAAAGAGLAVSFRKIEAGDKAGWYDDFLVVPRPGDVFEADVAAAAVADEVALYWASATLLATTGSNIIGYTVMGPNAPAGQFKGSQGQLGDAGETFRSTTRVRFVFRAACSFFKTVSKA